MISALISIHPVYIVHLTQVKHALGWAGGQFGQMRHKLAAQRLERMQASMPSQNILSGLVQAAFLLHDKVVESCPQITDARPCTKAMEV